MFSSPTHICFLNISKIYGMKWIINCKKNDKCHDSNPAVVKARQYSGKIITERAGIQKKKKDIFKNLIGS